MQTGKRIDRKPNFDMHAKLSRDGRFWIIKRVETWVLPRKYLDVIAQNHDREKTQATSQSAGSKPQAKGERNADSNGQGN